MEEEIEKNKDHPQIAPIYFPAELHRCEALGRDLEYFFGEDWQSQVSWKHSEAAYQSHDVRDAKWGLKDGWPSLDHESLH